MKDNYHQFFIPVMGTGHSVDTPIRLAPRGISSVISLVDDLLLEQIRKYYCEKYSLPYSEIKKSEEDGRAKRITAYLNTVWDIVQAKMEKIKKQPFFEKNDKTNYFELLSEESSLKKAYHKLCRMKKGPVRQKLEKDLTNKMKPGSIDVNIMVKLDCAKFDSKGNRLSEAFTYAKAALRGYANSCLKSSVVFSAGINQSLFSYMTSFCDFYRDAMGEIKKNIILKVSDFRSALIQGKFLAKRGLEIFEFRVESGLNCGGHAFPSNGTLLASVLKEFKDKREQLASAFQPLVKKYYQQKGWKYPDTASQDKPYITVQGGVGTSGEMKRLKEDFDIDAVGWASPFLLVPEATRVDKKTRKLLKKAGENELYVSNVSPLGVLFNNLRHTGSELLTKKRIKEGQPGSPCEKGLLKFNTEFSLIPICVASRQYQKKKLEEIDNMPAADTEKERLKAAVVEKTCICHHLGNGALLDLGLAKKKDAPQSICPGPNIAWFKKIYTLKKMVDHIYGKSKSLVSPKRPHMFAKEIMMYVDYFAVQETECAYTPREIQNLKKLKDNLEDSMDFCLAVSRKQPYADENLASIVTCVKEQRARLQSLYAAFKQKIKANESLSA